VVGALIHHARQHAVDLAMVAHKVAVMVVVVATAAIVEADALLRAGEASASSARQKAR
jgi:hypothetical protein